MTKRSYSHVFFDLDRTLWDFDTNSTVALTEIFESFDLNDLGEFTCADFIAKYKEINEMMWRAYRQGKIKKSELRRERFSRTLRYFDIKSRELGATLDESYIKISPYKTALLPGALETLEYLSSQYKLHIITNGFEEVQYIKMDNSGIRKFFDVIVTSERAKARKPDSIVFDLALSEAKATAAESVMIGDDLATDILGARNAWMDQVYFNPNGHDHKEDITYEIASLKELRAIL